jgi:hypothetical protein
MIAITQYQKQCDQENESANDFTEEMRNQRLPSLFEIKIPHITVDQSDNERSAEKNCCCSDVISPGRMDSVNRKCGVESEYQREEPK